MASAEEQARETDGAATPAEASAPGDEAPAPGEATPAGSADSEPAPRPRGGGVWLALVVVLAAGALAFWAWTDTRTRLATMQDGVALRLREMETASGAARRLAQEAQRTSLGLQQRIERLDARLVEAQAQQQSIEALYQELARNREDWQIAEIEQIVTIASQQLELAGNVRAALLALQLAETRLARADRPQFLPIRKALQQDIERLKSLPALDLPGLTLRLDRLIDGVDALPLAFEERTVRPGGATSAGAAESSNLIGRVAGELWREVRQLVIVRRMDAKEAPLLAPTQAFFLRENLRLRLLNARLALLMRDEGGYRKDLRLATAWIQRYFDPQAKRSAEMLAQLGQLASTPVGFDVPGISGSLESVRSLQARRERGS